VPGLVALRAASDATRAGAWSLAADVVGTGVAWNRAGPLRAGAAVRGAGWRKSMTCWRASPSSRSSRSRRTLSARAPD